MKHFEITYRIGTTPFVYECTTAREAFDALMDLGDERVSLGISAGADGYMKILIDMKDGKTLSHETHRVRIAYVDGEL